VIQITHRCAGKNPKSDSHLPVVTSIPKTVTFKSRVISSLRGMGQKAPSAEIGEVRAILHMWLGASGTGA